MRRFWLGLALLFLAAILVACVQPGLLALSPSGPAGSPAYQLLVIAPPGSTATPTPFQPIPPTPTYLPPSYPTPTTAAPTEPVPTRITSGVSKTWVDYPGPVVWPDIQIPPPTGILPQPEGQINILLLGSDQRPYEGGFRTDTIILLTLNPAGGTANLTSFPRDLYVYIPGWTVQRINTAFGYGGFDSLALTMEYNFGVHPDHYVLINLSAFEKVVNKLGGLDVQVGKDLCDHRDDYGIYCVYAGTVHMDGETALWYVRSRYTSNDLDRNRRQQEVIMAGVQKLLTLDALRRVPELYETYQKHFSMDLTLEDLLALLPLATQLSDLSNIQHYYIGQGQVTPWVSYSGAQVLLPIREAVLEVMKQALNSGQ
jgi:LCP family protein required for cell wall assembly